MRCPNFDLWTVVILSIMMLLGTPSVFFRFAWRGGFFRFSWRNPRTVRLSKSATAVRARSPADSPSGTSALGLSRTGLSVGVTSTYSSRTLDRLREQREAIRNVLARYGASNPRLFGSIAQGTAGPDSDVDLLLDLAAEGSGSRLSRLSGIRLELEELLKLPVDVVCEELLKGPVSESARSQAIAL